LAVNDVQDAVLAGRCREVQAAGCIERCDDGSIEILVVGGAQLVPPFASTADPSAYEEAEDCNHGFM